MEFQEHQQPTSFFSRYKKLIVGTLLAIGAIFVLLLLFSFLSMNHGSYGFSSTDSISMPGAPASYGRGGGVASEVAMQSAGYDASYAPTSSYLPPLDTVYVPGLEDYETTDYNVSGRLSDLSSACSVLGTLKARDDVHFKRLSQNKNNCSAYFFVEEASTADVVTQLGSIKGVDISSLTESVTRRRTEIKNQTTIVQEQLNSVERTLDEAKVQYDYIAEVARESTDAAALTEAIRDKLQIIDDLTERRIMLTSQLQQLNQQGVDLEERIGMVAFNVSLTRTFVVDSDRFTREWEAAWRELRDQFTSVLIGVTAYLGIFLLWVVQLTVYGLILVVLARFLWKLVRKIWQL